MSRALASGCWGFLDGRPIKWPGRAMILSYTASGLTVVDSRRSCACCQPVGSWAYGVPTLDVGLTRGEVVVSRFKLMVEMVGMAAV
jgi:hypothetical protein